MSDEKPPQQPELPSNSFLSVLQRKELQESLLTDASALLAELALAVKQSKKKGTLALTLTLEPQKGGAISVSAALNSKPPSTAPQHLTIYFLTEKGDLVRDNPDQQEFQMTSHEGGATTEGQLKNEERAQA